jgi:diguanylate cyclase (GGDEF)-like protein
VIDRVLELVKNKSTLVILLIIGVVVSVYAGKLIYDRETDAIKLSFRGDFSDKVQALQRELFLTEEVVHGLKSLYDCSENVEYEEFKTMVDSFLLRHQERIQGLSWNPRLSANQIDESAADYNPTFLETIRKDFPDFEITERDEQNKLVHVDVKKRKDDFFIPVAYIEPYPSNQKAHGFDIASNAQRKESIEAARDTDQIHATPTISLVQQNTRGVLVIAPLYDGKPITLESQREFFKGVVVGVFKVGVMADNAMKSTAVRNLSFELLEGNFSSSFTLQSINTGEFQPIYSSSEDQSKIFPELSSFAEIETITFANRTWGIKGVPFFDYVDQKRSSAPLLVVVFGALLSGSTIWYVFRILAVQEKLKHLTVLDSLTKVANKRGIIDYLNYEWRRCMRDGQSISICMIDIDDFKKFNDTYGHVAGDRCLQEVAGALQESTTRSVDMIGRYGGEEFCLIMPNTKDPNIVAKACLEKVRDLNIPHSSSSCSDSVSISIGLATTVPLKDDSLTNFLKTADRALYKAKNSGKNQIVIAEEVEHGHALAGDGMGVRSRKSATKQPW